MRARRIRLIALALVAALTSPTATRAAYEDVGVGARVTGLGGAYTAVADDVYSIYYNPAGLATLARPELSTTYSKLLTGLSDGSNLQNSFLAYAHPIQEGRRGTWGAAWNYLTLDSLYRETTLTGSYARALFAESRPNQFYGGVNLKYLNRSLGGADVANSALNPSGAATGSKDPVLQNASKTNIDADLGFLYRVKPRWTVGLMVSHLLEPDIAFSSSDSDKLGRNYRLGGSYKTPFSTLASDLSLRKAPDGSTDKALSLGAEKWLPTLMHGTFGVRAALSVGSRDYRQMSAGVSYKINRIQFDYGFAIPLGGIAGTSGSHRMGLTFRFGRARAAEASFGEALLENMQELAQVGTPEFAYQAEELAVFKRTAVEEFLRQARVDVGAGRFAEAEDKMAQALSVKPGDAKIIESRERLKAVAALYPSLSEFRTDPAKAALYQGVVGFLTANYKEALAKLSYSQSLSPADEKIEFLIQAVETKSGLTREGKPRAEALAAKASDREVAGAMALMEIAMRDREYDTVLKLAERVVELDSANALAYKRMGAAYYGLKKYPEALRALRLAYKHEEDGEARKSLRSYIDALNAQIEKLSKPKAPAAAPAPARPAAKTPQEIERLYETGVDLYAQGRLAEAARMFQRILEHEPGNTSARLALDRVSADILRASEKR